MFGLNFTDNSLRLKEIMVKYVEEVLGNMRRNSQVYPNSSRFFQRFGEMTYSISSEEEYVADNPGQVPREVVCTAFDENNAVMCFLDGIRFISEI